MTSSVEEVEVDEEAKTWVGVLWGNECRKRENWREEGDENGRNPERELWGLCK